MIHTRTKSRLSPLILIVCPPVTTVYLYSPILASFVLRLCIKALDALTEDGKALSSDADEFILELEPVKGPAIDVPDSLVGDAFLRIVSSINCLA